MMEDGGPRLECMQWRLWRDIVIVFDKVSGIAMEIRGHTIRGEWFKEL